jgi:hypothetical protein
VRGVHVDADGAWRVEMGTAGGIEVGVWEELNVEERTEVVAGGIGMYVEVEVVEVVTGAVESWARVGVVELELKGKAVVIGEDGFEL